MRLEKCLIFLIKSAPDFARLAKGLERMPIASGTL